MATLTLQIDAELLQRVQAIAVQRGVSVESVTISSLEEMAATGGSLRSFYDDSALVEMGKAPLRSQLYR